MYRNALGLNMCALQLFMFNAILTLISAQGWSDISFDGSYTLYQSVLMLDSSQDSIGYQIHGIVSVQRVHNNLLLVRLESPNLHVMTKKAPVPGGWIPHISNLDSALNNPFLVFVDNGKVNEVYIDSGENLAMINLKRSIASSFQFQIIDSILEETDISGVCSVTYKVVDHTSISKSKSNCHLSSNNLKDTLWGGKIDSAVESLISLSDERKIFKSVVTKESHILQTKFSEHVISKILTEMKIQRKEAENDAPKLRKNDGDIETAITIVSKDLGINLVKYNLALTKESMKCEDNSCPTLFSVVKENRKNLMDSSIGTSKSALAFLKVLQVVRQSSAEDIYNTIKSKDNKKILTQLMDVLGAAQTEDSHQAALRMLQINVNYNLDLCERYFWALSMSSNPQERIVQDLLLVVKSNHPDPKLWQTLVHTLSSMTKKFQQLQQDDGNRLMEEVNRLFIDKLNYCKEEEEDCRQLYLKAFANLGAPNSLPTLLKYAVNSTRKSGVAAMNAIKRLGCKNWDKDVILTAERIVLNNDSSDSSAKTIALDIILESNPSNILIAKMLSILRQKDSSKDFKHYMLQKMLQYSEKNDEFRRNTFNILHDEGHFQYDRMAQGGLSTAFNRDFMVGGSLSTTQEIVKGLLKKGYVDFNLDHKNSTETLFTLGLFSSGLGSFVSDGGDGGEEEEISAGLELTVLGVELRPFIFFSGQSELMGHVWAGTGSSKTPAYQAVLLMDEQSSEIPSSCGFIAEVSLVAAASVDLSGQIEISIWNRYAESLVHNSAGIAVKGAIKVESLFVKTLLQFNMVTEPKLDLSSDIQFSGDIALCLQLRQPSTTVNYTTYKIERIPGSKHKLRKTKYKKIHIPGKTYALNRKNNEMCNVINDNS